MRAESELTFRAERGQFGLMELFEWVTVCAVLMAFWRMLGLSGAICLMAVDACLRLRQGAMVLAALALGIMTCESRWSGPDHDTQVALLLLLAVVLCGAHRWRRESAERARGYR